MASNISAGSFVNYRYTGVAIAATIISAWATLLVTGILGCFPGHGTYLGSCLWVVLTTMAYTGLFITAHDAMHGLVAPSSRRLNRNIGALALMLYGAMSYRRLLEGHLQHHQTPASAEDPDYHHSESFFRWYVAFILEYATWTQCLIMAAAFNVLHHGFGVELTQLWIFWILPQVLSTFQLFVVGTYLPHRTGEHPEAATRTLHLPPWLSFLACYHFGYHIEHHTWPFVPWWKLPKAYQLHRAPRRLP